MPLKRVLGTTGRWAVIFSAGAYLLLALTFLWIMSALVSSIVDSNIERKVDWSFEGLAEAIQARPAQADSIMRSRLAGANSHVEIYSLRDLNGKILLTNYPYEFDYINNFQILPDLSETYCEDLKNMGQDIGLECRHAGKFFGFDEDSVGEGDYFEDDSEDRLSVSLFLVGLSDLIPSRHETEGYLARSEQVGDYWLTIGHTLDLADETRDVTFLLSLIFLPISLLMALLVGQAVKTHVGQRVNTINNTCSTIENTGNLALRIPNPHPKDEYGKLTGHINSMLDRLDLAVTQLEGVTDDIAHDLRTPLSRLRYRLESGLSLENGSVEDLNSVIEQSLVETDGLLDTFSSILRISQISSGQRQSKFREFDLETVTREMVEMFTPVATEKGHSLSLISSNTPARISGDENMLRQLIINLLENSIEHGGGSLDIIVECKSDKDKVVLSVADNGKGVDPHDHDRLFDKFYRGEQSRTTKGTGLGLALVKAIADLHNAHIKVLDNQPGLNIVLKLPKASDFAV